MVLIFGCIHMVECTDALDKSLINVLYCSFMIIWYKGGKNTFVLVGLESTLGWVCACSPCITLTLHVYDLIFRSEDGGDAGGVTTRWGGNQAGSCGSRLGFKICNHVTTEYKRLQLFQAANIRQNWMTVTRAPDISSRVCIPKNMHPIAKTWSFSQTLTKCLNFTSQPTNNHKQSVVKT